MRRLRPIKRRAQQREQPTAFESISIPEDDDALAEGEADRADDALDHTAEIVEATPAGVIEGEFAPFVPVTRNYASEPDRIPEAPSIDASPEDAPRRRRRLRVPLPRVPRPHLRLPGLPLIIHWKVLLLVLTLIAAGIVGTLMVRGDVRDDVRDWWPLVIAGVSVVWMLGALIGRNAAGFLGGAALGGVGLSLLMEVQGIASVQETLLGVVLIALGLGIAIRGLLLRQRVPYQS